MARFFDTHKGWKIAGIVVVVLIVIGVISNLTKKKTPATIATSTSTSKPAPATTTTTTRPIATTRPAPTSTTAKVKTVNTKLAGVINDVTNQVNQVAAAVQQGENNPTASNVDSLAILAQQAHDDISNDKSLIATYGNLSDNDALLYGGANDLKNSMGALVTYTGNPNPQTLASFTTQYNTAVAEWDSAVLGIYQGTSETPPTIGP